VTLAFSLLSLWKLETRFVAVLPIDAHVCGSIEAAYVKLDAKAGKPEISSWLGESSY
jgi:hypothetical protein